LIWGFTTAEHGRFARLFEHRPISREGEVRGAVSWKRSRGTYGPACWGSPLATCLSAFLVIRDANIVIPVLPWSAQEPGFGSGEDPLGVGDLLSEDAASGAGESFAAASLIAEAFEAGGLEHGEAFDHLVEFFAAHPGQNGVREGLGSPGPLGGDVVVVEEGAQLFGGGEAQGGGGDRHAVVGEELVRLGDPIADGEVADLEHVRQDLLGADLAEVDHGGQYPVRIGEQGWEPALLAWRRSPPRWWKVRCSA
jgi:hypothetical protein